MSPLAISATVNSLTFRRARSQGSRWRRRSFGWRLREWFRGRNRVERRCAITQLRKNGAMGRLEPTHRAAARNQETKLVGEDPARSEITGSGENDDCDHADRRCGVARQLKNSTHKFPSPSHRWSIPTQWLIACAGEKCNAAIVHTRAFAQTLALVANCKANRYSYIMRVDG